MRIHNPIPPMFRLAGSAVRFFFRHVELILVSALILTAAVQYYLRPQSQSLEQVLESGELRVLIADEPDAQFMLNRQHFGFEYDMLSELAKELGVTLSLDIVPYGELFTLLSSGEADLAVGGILESAFVHRVSKPTIPWYQAQTTVIYRRGTPRPRNLEDLQDTEILAGARYYQLGELAALNLVDDYRSEYDLFAAVDMGKERFVLSTNYRALNAKHYMPYLNRSFILPERLGVVWALPKRYDPALLERINRFLQQALDRKLPSQLATNYFKSPNRLSTYDVLAIHRKIKTDFPEYEFAFRKAARRGRLDWQLLAAMAYQESRWSNAAESPTGVRGIMQMTTNTARSLGVDDRLDMSKSIDAAARYVRQLKAELPKDIEEPERTWFAVGAYNVGLKHIRYAYRQAGKQGLDNTQWRSIREVLPTLYGERFSKGIQAKHYVDRVQIFTDIIRFYDLHQREDVALKRGVAVIGELESEE